MFCYFEQNKPAASIVTKEMLKEARSAGRIKIGEVEFG